MKVTLQVNALKEVMDLVGRFVSRHATLPILENVYIKANIDTIMFRATDMEKYIEIELPAKLDDEWSLTVNAKTFSDILRTIDEDHITLVIEESTDSLSIKSSNDEFKIKWIPASEYVAVPSVQSDQSITLDTMSFSNWIGNVEYAVTEKNFSPVLTGVFMRIKKYEEGKKLVFVGTDSFRLAEYKVAFDGDAGEMWLIVPKLHISDIKKVTDYCISKDVENMQMTSSDNMVCFSFDLGDMKLQCTSLLIQGSFPEYENENIMPTTWNTKVMLDASGLEKAIRKISILTRDINNFINISSEQDKLLLSSWQTDIGEGQTQVAAVVDGETVWFGVNGKYMSDFLRIIESDEVVMRVIDAEKPIIFKDKDDDRYTYVVRPLIK